MGVPMIEKDTIEKLLMQLGARLSKPTTLCVIGSTSSIVNGQPSRQTPGIDLWYPNSSFDSSDLMQACEGVGLIYDPKGEVNPDAIYMKVVRPGIVSLPKSFELEVIGQYGNLTIAIPPPELIVATKLVRGSDTDIEDAVWWIRGRDLTEQQILSAIESIPNSNNREAAQENLILVQLVSRSADNGGCSGPF